MALVTESSSVPPDVLDGRSPRISEDLRARIYASKKEKREKKRKRIKPYEAEETIPCERRDCVIPRRSGVGIRRPTEYDATFQR